MTIRVLVLFAMLGLARHSDADVIYTYVGHAYTDILDVPLPGGAYDTSMRVTGEFVLADALPAGMPAADITPLLTSFSFSDGRTTLTHLDPVSVVLFSAATDAFGALSAWLISIQQSNAVTGGLDVAIQTLNDPSSPFPIEDSGQLLACDPALLPRGLCRSLVDRGSVAAAGEWRRTESSTVPEPAMLGLYAVGLWAVRRRRGR